MFENAIAWAVLGLLFVLCLPLTGVKRLLLFVYGWALRLAMLGLIAGAGYLWFRPAQLPPEIPDTVRNIAWLKNMLPDPFTPLYGVWIAGLAGIVLLPLLAIIDICRSAVARHIEVVSTVTTGERVASAPARFSRRAAAETMAHAGSR